MDNTANKKIRYDVSQMPPCPGGTYYTIRSGDTLYALARRFNTTVDAIMKANPGLDPMNLQVGRVICIPGSTPPEQCPGGFQYTIVAGDTFFNLAQRYNTTVDAIMKANPGVDPNRLMIGQVICIPGSTPPEQCPGGFQYTIVAGDTFFNLARRFNTTVDAIMAANPGVDPNRLMIGQVICIPGSAPGPIPCPGGTIYTVKQGDSLYIIALRFGVSLDRLIAANPQITDPSRLTIGQPICIPPRM